MAGAGAALLGIARRPRWDDEGIHNDDFKEPWANKYPHKKATSYWYHLTMDGALIERFILVAVDGRRATQPLPPGGRTEVRPLDYKVAQIFDGSDTLDNYMDQSGLNVRESPTRPAA